MPQELEKCGSESKKGCKKCDGIRREKRVQPECEKERSSLIHAAFWGRKKHKGWGQKLEQEES